MSTTESQPDPGSQMSTEQLVMMAATASQLVARKEFANKMGQQFGGDRELWDALGYPNTLRYRDYKDWYDRGDIAKPIIEKPPGTTWSERPDIVDDADTGEENQTDFESDVEALFDASKETKLRRGLRHYLERADTLGRIGRYSVIFLGLSDVSDEKELREAVDTNELDGLDDLLYLTPLGEGDASIKTWVEDATDPRNGFPKTYSLDLSNGNRTNSLQVHHTRVIHVAEGILDDEVMGEPALRAVINRLFDLQKVYGASAEAYWMVANPGIVLNVDPSLKDIPTDWMEEQTEEYEHNLRRIMKLIGTEVNQLEAQDVNPEETADSLLKAISGTIEIPTRKLLGSEQGELASSQDEASYLEMIGSRQTSYAEPVLLRPLIDRLERFGIISPPRAGSYTVEWPNLFQLTDLEEAKLLKELAQAVREISPMNDPEMLHSIEALREFSPIDEPEDATPPDEADDVDEEIDEDSEEVQDQFERIVSTQPLEADD